MADAVELLKLDGDILRQKIFVGIANDIAPLHNVIPLGNPVPGPPEAVGAGMVIGIEYAGNISGGNVEGGIDIFSLRAAGFDPQNYQLRVLSGQLMQLGFDGEIDGRIVGQNDL